VLFANLLGNWFVPASTAFAASHPRVTPATMTFQQFLARAKADQQHRPRFVRPTHVPTVPLAKGEHLTDPAHLPPTAEPPSMHPMQTLVDASFLKGGSTVKPLDLVGSDGRLEVQVQPGSFDLSHATTSAGAFTGTTVMLSLSQDSGHFAGETNLLGTYRVQLTDLSGHSLNGVQVRTPLTLTYHYQPWELTALDLNPDRLYLTWPDLLATARKAHQPLTAFMLSLHHDAHHHLLTAQSSVLDPVHPFDLGGDAQNQSPPPSLFASVQGNSGQSSYSYPLQVVPGAGGFAPSLMLSYSSGDTNSRQAVTAAASSAGDGWSLSLGSITASAYPSGSASTVPIWYFINDVANVSDRLTQSSTGSGGSFYETQHISHLRILQLPGNSGCFHVWDRSGGYYEFGCTADSLQYRTDSNGTHSYRYDLNKIIAANEGPGTLARVLTISYEQDKPTLNGYTSVRDAVIKQITYSEGSTIVGIVDFSYKGTYTDGRWVSAYPSNYNCNVPPPYGTTFRCDDPIDHKGGGTPTVYAPQVFSTFSLQAVTSYAGGNDGDPTTTTAQYTFTYKDTPFQSCVDPLSQLIEFCAGDHLLTTITPTMYQNGTAHQLKPVFFGYNQKYNTYSDQTQTVPGGAHYFVETQWQYLADYLDSNTGVAGHLVYMTAYGNTHGTPAALDGNGHLLDNRYDPTYCFQYANNPSFTCNQGSFQNPNDRMWTQQVVTTSETWSTDSSALSAPAMTTYSYALRIMPTIGTTCPADSQGNTYCVGDYWLPVDSGNNHQDTDWGDYYHGEYRGFSTVEILSPANNLTVDTYYTADGWWTASGYEGNYNAGHLTEEDVYQGAAAQSNALLRKTVNYYTGNGNSNSCDGNVNLTYVPCAIHVLNSTTTLSEGTSNSNAPWVKTTNTFDDYDLQHGLSPGYGNLMTAVVTSSNAPTYTRTWTYQPNDQTVGTWVYYNVSSAIHSELDDANGHVWACQDIAYDEGIAPKTPDQGLPTTTKVYSDCSHQSSTAITSYTGYDGSGNVVATIDALATANSSLYGSGGKTGYNGCTLGTAPVTITGSSNWNTGRYTTCTTYDQYNAQPATITNALGQSSSIAYDYTQGALPVHVTDANGQQTSSAYSYDSHGNRTVQIAEPGETLGYTTQSSTNSGCGTTLLTSVQTPCFEMDSTVAAYSGAISRTFYDRQGRAVETRRAGPGSYDTVSFTVYNDTNNTVFQSVPFQVASGSAWLDPNGAKDYNGNAPGGTTSYADALGRLLAVQDPLFGTGADGITCSATLSGPYTACTNYGLGQATGDPNVPDANTYAITTSIDPNNHVALSYTDALGRTLYVQYDSGGGSNNGTLSPNEQKSIQYNALNEPTQVRVDDLSPQTNQTITTIITTAQYDDLGRLTSLADPDKGTHTYSYDPDGRILSDVSGSRTLGSNYDLLGRLGCEQEGVPVINADGSCTSGTNPLVQNTYDTTKLGTQGSTDFPIGRLTKSLSSTYFPEGGSATTTQKFQYDTRGQVITTQLLLKLPNSWNVSSALPTYQASLAYDDLGQPTNTSTSTLNPSGSGLTETQVYDNTGSLSGLSSTSNPVANLATVSYNVNALVGRLNFLTSTGSNLAYEQFSYDANLRPVEATAIWQNGSGNTGQIFDQSRWYDPASNVTSLSTTQAVISGQSLSGGSETQDFCYDEQSRLVWAGNSGTVPGAGHGTCGTQGVGNTLNGASYSNSLSYTHLGELWHAPVNGSGGYKQYLYCDSTHPHQLTGIYPTGTTCPNPTGALYSTSYDAWGNATSRTYNGSTATLSYDKLDQMVEWQNSTTNTQEWYIYDAAGHRVLRRSTSSGTTTLTSYAFGSEDHTYSGSGTPQSSTYYYSLGGRLIGELTTSPAQTNIILTDALGSILATFSTTANSAALLGNQTYGPYGSQQYQSGSMGTAKGFTGQYADATGLDYYNARYYDPVASVFLSADSVQGNAQGMNPYDYVGGNPETHSDPTGQYVACGDTCGSGGSSNGHGSGRGPVSSCYALDECNGGGVTPSPSNTQLQYDATHYFHRTTPTFLSSGLPGLLYLYLYDHHSWVMLEAADWSVMAQLWQEAEALLLQQGIDWNASGAMELLHLKLIAVTIPVLIMYTGGGIDHHVDFSGAMDGSGDTVGGFCSFTAQTLVATGKGEHPIGSLHVGDKVWAYNPTTRKMELESVLHVWIHQDNDLVDLTLTTLPLAHQGKPASKTNEVIHTNQKHPFLTVEHGFLSVREITVGMHIERANGSVGVVTGWKVVPGTKVMYNLEVQQDHTFTVGVGQWVVHNCPPTGPNVPDFNGAAHDIQNDYNLGSAYNGGKNDPSTWKFIGSDGGAYVNDDPNLIRSGFTERYYLRFQTKSGVVRVSADFNPGTGAWNDTIGNGFHLSSTQENDFWQQETNNQW